jgi:hypothetical protein
MFSTNKNQVMYELLSKRGQTFALLACVAIIIIYFVPVFMGMDAFDALPDDQKSKTTIFNFGLIASIVIFAAAILITIFLAIYQMAANPKGSLKGLLAIGAILVFFVILYFMADDTVKQKWSEELSITPNISKFVGAATILSMVMLGFSVLVLIAAEVKNIFK